MGGPVLKDRIILGPYWVPLIFGNFAPPVIIPTRYLGLKPFVLKAEMESKIAAGEEKLAATDSEKAKREAAVEETKKATEDRARDFRITIKVSTVTASFCRCH